jgi:hypothetical protein
VAQKHNGEALVPTNNRSATASSRKLPRIAAVVTAYHHNSHADVIVSRLMQTYTLDDRGDSPKLRLVSLFTDQVPGNDISRKMARKYSVPIFKTIDEALTLGTGELAVDGVLLVAEHGDYPYSDTGNRMYPKRRLFMKVVNSFQKHGKVVPVFLDKQLSDNWTEAKSVYDTARKMKIPLMAGSSLPVLWRFPAVNLRRDAPVKELVAVSYSSLDAYGFHALEMVQSLVERRQGGETGVRSVQCLVDDAVWEVGRKRLYDPALLTACLSRLSKSKSPTDKSLEELVEHPVLFQVNYRDGLRVSVLTLPSVVEEWAVAWRDVESGTTHSTLFWTQEARPYTHFEPLVRGCERMFHSGKPTWPAERTLLTSGLLDALLISKRDQSRLVETPYLNVTYQSDWDWQQPPPPARGPTEP